MVAEKFQEFKGERSQEPESRSQEDTRGSLEITARDVSSIVPFWVFLSAGLADEPITRWNVLGSRLFKGICGHARAKTNNAGLLGTTQSGSPPGGRA
jgi:hypothetical protein